jgi:hypothetical protein
VLSVLLLVTVLPVKQRTKEEQTTQRPKEEQTTQRPKEEQTTQ